MKIKRVIVNNRKKVFEIETANKHFIFPYSKLEYKPSFKKKIVEVFVDKELGREAFTYVLESGQEGTVHIDHVLEYNEDTSCLRDLLLYKLTLEVQRRVEKSSLSHREIIRRLGTSPAQFYRILDQTNYRKSIDQALLLLYALECEVDLVVKDRDAVLV
ncbi:MAG: hypothetical protein ACUZ8E_04830 [Candidatus Anammoxibacter sp.]